MKVVAAPVDNSVDEVDNALAARRRAALESLQILDQCYPEARCALRHESPLQLLVATILSAQCTDARVNLITPALFTRFPDAATLATASLTELEILIHSTGFYRSKARNLIGCATALVTQHGGAVPATLPALTALPGVGRKTANVVLGNAFGIPGLAVDTHVRRLAGRLDWSRQSAPEKIEGELCALLPQTWWTQASHLLIHHGRAVCRAQTPQCSRCPLLSRCPRRGVRRSA